MQAKTHSALFSFILTIQSKQARPHIKLKPAGLQFEKITKQDSNQNNLNMDY